MQIVCSHCQAEYEIDPPAAPFARMQDLVFRCTACGASIPIRAASAEAPERHQDTAGLPGRHFVLKQDGKTYTVGDAATLQRWIAERRVGPEDRVSVDGGGFGRVGDWAEFEVFFKLVADAERTAVSPALGSSTPTAVPEPNPSFRKSVAVARAPTAVKSKGGSLFARPAGLPAASRNLTTAPPAEAPPAESATTGVEPEPVTSGLESPEPVARTADTAVRSSTAVESLADEEVAAQENPMVASPSFDPDAAQPMDVEPPLDAPPEAATVSVNVEEWGLGEALPDEAGPAETQLAPDEDTMDMELDEEDFFSEERMSLAMPSMDDDDEDLEWGQTRRSNMAVWWLLFLGGLGGSGFVALEWLNQSDQTDAVEEVVSNPPGDELPAAVAQPTTERGADEDSGSVDGAQGPTSTEDAPTVADELPPTADGVASAERAAEVDVPEPAEAPTSATPPVASPPAAKPAAPSKPAPPAKPSAGREAERGWAQIDRGNWDGARRHFNTALSVNRSHPDARLGLAYVDEHQGRIDEAVRQYCSLAATAAGDVKNEANGRLRSLDRACP